MRFMKASKVERFLTYFIDFAIIGVLASAIASGVYAIAGYDTNIINDILNRLMLEMEKIYTGDIDMTTFQSLYKQYMQYALFEMLVSGIIYFVLILIYLVILPMFWKNQTVGRLIMKTKVVDKDGNEVSKKAIILRELVGSFLLYAFFGGVFMLITAVLVLTKERSLVDYIGGTDLASIKYVPQKDNIQDEGFNEPEPERNPDDYVDAKFKEVEDAPKEEDKFKIDDDDYKII